MIVAQIPDACGGTRLSSFLLMASIAYGPGWFWQQALMAATRN